jgi:hypothetical protein
LFVYISHTLYLSYLLSSILPLPCLSNSIPKITLRSSSASQSLSTPRWHMCCALGWLSQSRWPLSHTARDNYQQPKEEWGMRSGNKCWMTEKGVYGR